MYCLWDWRPIRPPLLLLCSFFVQIYERFIYVLQGVQSGRHVSDCHSLWQELRQLSRKMGNCFCYIYGTVIVIWFAALTLSLSLSLYGGLIGIFNHGIHLKGITLLGNALLCTSVLFVISDAGQRVCQEVSNVIVRVSVRTMYFHNYCLVSPIK